MRRQQNMILGQHDVILQQNNSLEEKNKEILVILNKHAEMLTAVNTKFDKVFSIDERSEETVETRGVTGEQMRGLAIDKRLVGRQ